MPISLPSIALASVDSSSVPAPVGLSTERLTRAEIHARYPNQWVVLVAVEYEGDLLSEIRSAIVAGAGGSEESLEQADPYIAHYGWFAREHTRPADPPRALGHEVREEVVHAHGFLDLFDYSIRSIRDEIDVQLASS